jgi:hypothetical protein
MTVKHHFKTNLQKETRMKPVSSSPAAMGPSMKNRNTIFTTMKKLTLALLVAAEVNVPSAKAILIPLPGGAFNPAFHTSSGSAPTSATSP